MDYVWAEKSYETLAKANKAGRKQYPPQRAYKCPYCYTVIFDKQESSDIIEEQIAYGICPVDREICFNGKELRKLIVKALVNYRQKLEMEK